MKRFEGFDVTAFFNFIKKREVVSRDEWLTVPNMVTFSGFLLAPLFIHFAHYGNTSAAVTTLLFMTAGDIFDGAIARAFNQFSEVGKRLDWFRDWWYSVVIPFLPILLLPKSFLVVYSTIALMETDILLLTKRERLAEVSGGVRHLILKTHSLAILALGAFAVLYPELILWMLLLCLVVSVATRFVIKNKARALF